MTSRERKYHASRKWETRGYKRILSPLVIQCDPSIAPDLNLNNYKGALTFPVGEPVCFKPKRLELPIVFSPEFAHVHHSPMPIMFNLSPLYSVMPSINENLQ